MANCKAVYTERFPHLQAVAEELTLLLQEHLRAVPRIDRISARAKAPERFVAKASKTNENGSLRYGDPLAQIQDQIGARVVVFYKSDVDAVAAELEKYLRPIEREDHVPESDWEFGYFGRHWLFALPRDAIPKEVPADQIPRFFELQVKTLFQHAWSEANHDLAYKAPSRPSSDQYRRFAYTAAQAWGADRVFNELWAEFTYRDASAASAGGAS